MLTIRKSFWSVSTALFFRHSDRNWIRARLSLVRAIKSPVSAWRRVDNRMRKRYAATVHKRLHKVGPPQEGITDGPPRVILCDIQQNCFVLPGRKAELARGIFPRGVISVTRSAWSLSGGSSQESAHGFGHRAQWHPEAPRGSVRWRCELRQGGPPHLNWSNVKGAPRSAGISSSTSSARRILPASSVMGPPTRDNRDARDRR